MNGAARKNATVDLLCWTRSKITEPSEAISFYSCCQRSCAGRHLHCDPGHQQHRLRQVPDRAQLRGRPLLDGGQHGDDDPLHPPPGFALRVGDKSIPAGLPHHHRLHRDDDQLHILGQDLRQVRQEAGFDCLRNLPLLLWLPLHFLSFLPMDSLPQVPDHPNSCQVLFLSAGLWLDSTSAVCPNQSPSMQNSFPPSREASVLSCWTASGHWAPASRSSWPCW